MLPAFSFEPDPLPACRTTIALALQRDDGRGFSRHGFQSHANLIARPVQIDGVLRGGGHHPAQVLRDQHRQRVTDF
jgi:hypothetical protein